MGHRPAHEAPGRDEDPGREPAGRGWDPRFDGDRGWRLRPSSPDWPAGYHPAELPDDDPPSDGEEDAWAGGPDPEDPEAWLDDADLAAVYREAAQVTADAARARAARERFGLTGAEAGVAAEDRRGPGMPGSAKTYPGEYTSRASSFASGMPLDTASGCVSLGLFADEAAGDDDRYAGASDDELAGVICGWDRVQAHAAARKYAAVAEFIRRRAARRFPPEGPAGMPAVWDEFAPVELAAILGESRWAADQLLDVAYDLEVKLPGTKAAFRDGIICEAKAGIIARATTVLDPGEARAAEALVLGRAGTLTPAGLAAAIARAVMQVAPEKARKRREQAAKQARLERWAEASGNAGLAGRELPPAQVLAADQRVNWWAKQLRAAGVAGSMDELRARAYLDILLNRDSRQAIQDGEPGQEGADGPDGLDGTDAAGGAGGADGPGWPEPAIPGDPGGSVIPAGFAGKINLTVPATTLLDLADRPGELSGIGPVDPDLARDLARAAAANPKTTWCVTVTDTDGHAIGHGCARPEPRNDCVKRGKPGGHDPPGSTGTGGGPRFTFTPDRRDGPAGGCGTWRLSTGIPGRPDLIISIGPLTNDPCDHRHQARGHDPGVTLRHLTQIRYATCTGPGCRRPAAQSDFEHNVPYEAGGRTCLCNGDPKCRHDHRLKQHPRWTAEHLADGTIRWTMPSGRQHTTEPTRYPV
jgi:Domain of unknown function (DUF222)